MSSKGSAHVELETSEVKKLRIDVQQMTGESQEFLLDAMRNILVEVKRDNGRLESGSAKGSAAVGESLEGAGPTAAGQSPAGAGPTAVRETIFVMGVFGISERRVTEKLLLLSRLVQRGISQISQEGWRDGCIPYRRRHGNWHLVAAPAARGSSRLCESGITDFLETGRRDRTLGMSCTPAMVQVAATATEKADVGDSTNEVDGGSAAAAGGDGSSAEATEGSAPVRGCYRRGKKGHVRANCTEKQAGAADEGTMIVSAPRRRKRL